MAFNFEQFGKPGTATEIKPVGGFDFNSFGQESEPRQPDVGFAQSVVQSIASPFLRLGATAADKEIDVGYLGKAKPIESPVKKGGLINPQTGELQNPFSARGFADTIGTGLDIASNIPVARGATTAARVGLKGLAKAGIKAGIQEGAVAGGLVGLGKALQAGKSAGEVVLDTATGVVGGGVFGGALGGGISVAGMGVRKGIQKVTGDVVSDFKDKAVSYLNKAIRPSVKGKQGFSSLSKYYDDAVDAVISIHEAKPTFTDDAGRVISRAPENLSEFAQGLEQAKGSLYRQYHKLATDAGEAGVGFDPSETVRKLDSISKDIGRRIELREYAKSLIPEIEELAGQAPDVIESRVQDLNSSLQSFFNGSVTKIKAELDASVAGSLRQNLDNMIDRAGGLGYQTLRNRYKALKTIEKDVINRAVVDLRKNAKGLTDLTDVFSGGNIIQGLLTLNPQQIALGTGQKIIAQTIKRLNDPNRYVKKLFSLVDDVYSKSGGNLRSKILPKARSLLPPGKSGAPQSQNFVPQRLGARSQSTIDKQEISRIQAQKLGVKKNEFLGAVAGIEQDDEGNIGFSGEKAAAGVAGISAIKSKQGEKIFKGFTDLTTKILEKLKGRSSVSKQFISDLTNSPDLKQAERDVIRNTLADFGDDISVKDFANKVKTELLPLKGFDHLNDGSGASVPRYESISLPTELRGPIADYKERIYSSPIKTSAGDVHFSGDNIPNYFAHTRIEDLPADKYQKALGELDKRGFTAEEKALRDQGASAGSTRRVIELQSDLFQKGRLEGEKVMAGSERMAGLHNADDIIQKRLTDSQYREYSKAVTSAQKSEALDKIKPGLSKEIKDQVKELEKGLVESRSSELAKLEPYRNTWHERLIREEVKQAAIDGKTKLQFPTGETAMKIEGLGQGDATRWMYDNGNGGLGSYSKLTPDKLKVGMEIADDNIGAGTTGSDWIITDVLGDGKFKAVPKDWVARAKADTGRPDNVLFRQAEIQNATETFDISGKVDTNNPIYKFYEKEVGRYLKNKYGAELITDAQGVKWWEINVKKEQKRLPVEAFGVAPIFATNRKKED